MNKLSFTRLPSLSIPSKFTNPTPLPGSIFTFGANIPFSPLVRSLGVALDPTLTFRQHISNVCKTAYFELGRLGSNRHYLAIDATETMVCFFVLSRLDYSNSLLVGSPKYILRTLKQTTTTTTTKTNHSPGNLHVSKT